MPPIFPDRPTHTLGIDDPTKRRSPTPPLTKLPITDPKSQFYPTPEPAAGQLTPKPSPESAEPEPVPTPSESDEPLLETIDMETFHQILDLDEDGTHEFSREMALAYFSQASTTFVEMDQALASKDLAKLSSLGHFLKGSSAALGVSKVQASCEKIQHYGQLRDEEEGKDLSHDAALDKIHQLLGQVKAEYSVAETWLKKWYADHEEEKLGP